jgi:hypothetical protein
MRSVNMRTFRGYCMRQARREVYKAMRKTNRRHTHTEYKKVETNPNDIWIGLGFIIGLIIFLNIISQI